MPRKWDTARKSNRRNPQWYKRTIELEHLEELRALKGCVRKLHQIESRSKTFGNVLMLDNVFQCTERDEFAYQEMIAHLPLHCHRCPKHVLVVGGGDGGVVREVLKHRDVEHVTLCEIDGRVVDLCKIYFPKMASCLSDPRVTVFVGDGLKYVAEHKGMFDVIITDSSDPIGPAVGLFEEKYFQDLKAALKPNGIISSQGETMWFDLDLIAQVSSTFKRTFKTVSYATLFIPTYTGGQIGIFLCSDNEIDFRCPVRKLTESEVKEMELKYYNSEVHTASFSVPQFVKEALSGSAIMFQDDGSELNELCQTRYNRISTKLDF